MKKETKKTIVAELGIKLVFDAKANKFKTFIRLDDTEPFQRINCITDLVRMMVQPSVRITTAVKKVSEGLKWSDKDWMYMPTEKTVSTFIVTIDGSTEFEILTKHNTSIARRRKTIINNICRVSEILNQ